jgi:flavin-dependent dehydrogenase
MLLVSVSCFLILSNFVPSLFGLKLGSTIGTPAGIRQQARTNGYCSNFKRCMEVRNRKRMSPIIECGHLPHGLGSNHALRAHHGDFDVAVLGGGPAGMTISFLLQTQHNLKVAMVDPRGSNPKTWYPNYGEWRDEWHALSERLKLPELKECTTNEWEMTDCFLGGMGNPADSDNKQKGMSERLRLSRPYVRVDRVKMQQLMHERFLSHQGHIIDRKVSGKISKLKNLFTSGIVHHADGTMITLDNNDTLQSKIVIDATGFESRLVKKEDPRIARENNKELPTGYQIAYGYIANVDSLGPYDMNAMTLFDYR